MATTATLDSTLRMYGLRDLTAGGWGSRGHLLGLIHSGELPAVMMGNAWKVRETDLAAYAGVDIADLHESRASQETRATEDMDDLATFVAQIVSTWPRLSAERRRELSRLAA